METEKKKTFDSELRQSHDFHSLNGVPPLGFFDHKYRIPFFRVNFSGCFWLVRRH